MRAGTFKIDLGWVVTFFKRADKIENFRGTTSKQVHMRFKCFVLILGATRNCL